MGQVVSEQSKGNGKAEIYLQAGCSSRFGEQPGFLVAIVYKVHHQAYAVQYMVAGRKSRRKSARLSGTAKTMTERRHARDQYP